MKEYGFVRLEAISPKIKVGNPKYNAKIIVEEIKKSKQSLADIILTPELSLTGYTCQDLFLNESLLKESIKALEYILNETKNIDSHIVLGMPLAYKNRLYNVALVINKGKILGITPKINLPNYQEFYEKRWFTSGEDILDETVKVLGEEILFSTNLIFKDKEDERISFAIEICEDLWSINPPSTNLALNGATIILNLSASNELIGKSDFRKELIKSHSSRLMCSYIYASSGTTESTTDLVFSGHLLIGEAGKILKESEKFNFESTSIIEDVDVFKLSSDRLKNKTFGSTKSFSDPIYVDIDIKSNKNNILRTYPKTPFVPVDTTKKYKRCEDILDMQSSGLIKRLLSININKTVIGISGGLDSTLALLVILRAYKKMCINTENIICVTMPGFGTTDKTYNNACDLVKKYGCTLLEIDITNACKLHFDDINLDESLKSVAYENSQARERTQILMDIANKENAIVVGTGDLSELALGFCTFNGDHMSNYAVNSGVPKTLVKHLVSYVALNEDNKILEDIINTPISPELLPFNNDDTISQVTEDIVGPYILHDYFLYHFLRFNTSFDKIYLLALNSFKDDYTKEEIKHWLGVFIKRFFQNQFKRNAIPDGPKIGSVSLSPRGDFKMVSDVDYSIWIDDLCRKRKK